MTTMAQKIKPYRRSGRFGILNHVGQVWTCNTFDTAAEAQKYVDDYQARNRHCNLRRHKVVPVRVTVSVVSNNKRKRNALPESRWQLKD